MYTKLFAVIAAAAGAAAIVGFIPPPPPASAAKAPPANVVAATQPEASARVNAQLNAVVPVSAVPAAGCKQGWPHYEQNCLRDSRGPNGTARVVRIVAIDHAAADRSAAERLAAERSAANRLVADRSLRPRH